MAEQVGSATASGSVARPGAGAGEAGAAGAGAGGPEVVPFVSQVPGTPVHFPSFHGRSVSWVAVSLIMAAFLVGGLALVFGPIWWLFWASLGLAVVGLLMCAGIGIFDDWY
ncbi:MAG: hypothetical protein J2P28_05405 [Actinobacteria bacterium]|nr:hypothetical protein [Actinomycetota bacterium]MBO0834943.1 hypothetical protein [Actinomycetota bacterium]